MSRGVARLILTFSLAWALLVPLASAYAETKHCSYQFHIGFIPAGQGGPVPIGAPVAVPGAHFKVKGRVPGSCDWWKFFCMDYGSLARMAAASAAESCARDSVGSGGARPESCTRKQDFSSGTWGQVVEWSVGDIQTHAFQAICQWARQRGEEISRITIWAVRESGWNSACDIRGRKFFLVWQSPPNQNPCTRPVASDPTGGVGRPPEEGGSTPGGRPLPADPTGGLPPPPGHGITAAPDLMVEKELEKTCLPNVPCTFKVTITNDGLGTFNGPLTVTDTISPASERLTRSGPAPWACEGGDGRYTCKHPGLQLATGQSAELSLSFTNTDKGRGTVENCARIDWEIPPLEGLCTAAIEEALARERADMDEKAASETDKAIKEFQCKYGVEPTGKPDTALLRMAFKSLGMGDTNAENDISCTASSIDLPEPDTATLTPEDTQCTGGRFRSRSTGECLCPSNTPAWDGTRCKPRGRASKPPTLRPPSQTEPPGTNCTGGRYWDQRVKGCRCPASAPEWNGKTCYRRITKPAPAPTPPTCSGGRHWNASIRNCQCPAHMPVWDGKNCKAWQPPVTPGITAPLCAGGMVWNKQMKSCRCPSSKPVWNAKARRCVKAIQAAPPKPVTTPSPTYTPPTTTAPPKPKIVCRGGQMVGALCWCGIGKFPKKVGNNVYRCQ